MAASYSITTGRTQRLSMSGSPDSVEINWERDYFVDVSGVTASEVDAYDVAQATDAVDSSITIPIVNRSVYTIGGKVIPFVVCRSKSVTQNPDRLDRWTVRTSWKGKGSQEESDNQPITPPAALTGYTPHEVPILGEELRALWIDKTGKRYQSPTGNEYDNPLLERVPTLALKITQYESAPLLYTTMLDRLFKCNESTYRGQGRYKWMIVGLDPTVVDTELSGGSTTAIAVTYTVALSPRQYGWKEDLALIDTHHLVNSVKTPFTEGNPPTLTSGLIDVNGVKKTDQTVNPDRIQFEAQDTKNFLTSQAGGFLQV